MTNWLYYGDNLEVLRAAIADASVDLVYLDPPFNSNAGYNVLFKSASGAGADASIEAFDDTWTWGEASRSALLDIDGGTNRPLQVMMRAMHDALGDSPLMAYLAMMAVRLVELHRVLRDTGSLYLHCDPTASHYLKLVLDAVFGAENYRNELVWKRVYGGKSDAHQYGRNSDRIFFYTKSRDFAFHAPREAEHNPNTVKQWYSSSDDRGPYVKHKVTAAGKTNGDSGQEWRGRSPNGHWIVPQVLASRYETDTRNLLRGSVRERLEILAEAGFIEFSSTGNPFFRRYLDEADTPRVHDIWADEAVKPINRASAERLGYPTQKPRALLERIIAASSNPGDVVLDPFCGCGTAVDAAQKLGRQWIGIDITHIAIGMIENRMREGYPGIAFETIGVPRDLASAERLAADDPHQFQQWVSWQVGGYPRDKKGGDKGIDGWFNYEWVDPDRPGQRLIETGVISVKAGDIVNPNMVRDLGRVMARDKYRFGLFIMKSLPTKGMREEAASHPLVETQWGRFPALQIVTLAELMHGHPPKLPPLVSPVKKAARVETRASHQKGSQGNLL